MKKNFGFVFVLFFILACNTPALTQQPGIGPTAALPATQPPVDLPTEAPSATAQSDAIIPEGEIASMGGISFLMPNGMASDASSVMTGDVEFPYIYPMEQPMPQHAKFILNNYPVQGAMFEPQIMVFNAAEYAQYGTSETQLIAVLTHMNFTDDQPLPAGLPVGAGYNAQVYGINFQNGKGIRYLTQFDQAPVPANNQGLIYYFHGITNDGQYYVEAILPVQAPFFAADSSPNSLVPADGIPFPVDMEGMIGYYSAITERLNATDTFSFTPYLDHLDSMMESIQITGF